MRQLIIIVCEELLFGFPTRGQPPSYDEWLESYDWSKVVKCGKTRKNSENRENRVKNVKRHNFLKKCSINFIFGHKEDMKERNISRKFGENLVT